MWLILEPYRIRCLSYKRRYYIKHIIDDLISKQVLLKEIEDNYDCNYGQTLINPRNFYNLVDEQTVVAKRIVEQDEI